MVRKLTQAEVQFIKYQLGLGSSFTDLLIKTIMHADEVNSMLLRLGFPDLVSTVDRYRNEAGYWEQLQLDWEDSKGQ